MLEGGGRKPLFGKLCAIAKKEKKYKHVVKISKTMHQCWLGLFLTVDEDVP